MIPHIKFGNKTIVFAAICYQAFFGHIPLPYVMGYDTKPLVTLNEKEKFLNEAEHREYIIFFYNMIIITSVVL